MLRTITNYCVCFAGLLLLSHGCQAQSTVRIEEDWELHVTHPDEHLDAPQVTTMMLPFGGASDLLFALDVNHGSTPSFSAGGFQIRISEGEFELDSCRTNDGEKLNQASETVRWTQVVQKATSGYYFGVINGSSQSFGSFGGNSSATFISNGDCGVVSLNAYDIQSSIENSGVTYAGNRVDWLRLKRVRLYNSNGQSIELSVNTDVE